MRRRIKRSGFTLIELLVVIGIVVLLTALLFPVFARAREKSRQTVCLSNERHLGMAFLMYAQDNNEFVPPDLNSWAAAIYPYTKSVGVFHCPSDATDAQPPYYPVSYGINANLLHVIGRHLVPHSVADMSPTTVLFFEVVHATAEITTPQEGWDYVQGIAPRASSVQGVGGDAGPLWCVGTLFNGTKFDIDEDVRYATGVMSPSEAGVFYEGPGRHHAGANFAFADTHVQWLSPAQVSTGGDAPAPDSDEYYGIGPVTAAGSENSHFAATFSMK